MHTFPSQRKNLLPLIIGLMTIVSFAIMPGAYAVSPPTLPGAHLIRPTLGSISGSTTFEAELVQSSPQDDSTVAFTLYRLIDGSPFTGHFCFLSPTATHISGTTRWLIASVNTRTTTGNCSSSQTTTGTLQAPRDGTYRFGIWIDGTEYLTPDSVTIQNGNPEDVPITNEEEPPPQNQNTNTATNQNTNTSTGNANAGTNIANQNTNQGTNKSVNTNQSTNTQGSNENTNGQTSNTNASPQEEPIITFERPSAGATLQGDIEVAATVKNAPDIQEVVYSVYSRGVWYTIGKASPSGSSWSVTWTTSALPDGVVYGVIRISLGDGRMYASETRQFTISNATPQPSTNENANTLQNSNTEPPHGSSSNTNTGIPAGSTATPPPPDADNDGVADEKEVSRGTDPHIPGLTVTQGRTFTQLPSSHPLTDGDTDDTLRVVRVIGPGIIPENAQEEPTGTYAFSGIGLPLDYLSLFVYSDTPIVTPVQVNSIGTWQISVDIELETGAHSAYIAVLDSRGNVDRKSEVFPFTIDPDALKSPKKKEAPWLWIGVGAAVLTAFVVGGTFFLRQSEKGIKGEV
ncbi:MAG: Ig-like domain-containing protein [Parcubacteria group bacterium]